MKLFILSILLITSLFSLDNQQILLLNTVYHEGKKYKASDNFSFEKTLCAIYITESSAGKIILGDKYTRTGVLKTLYESSLGPGQIRLETAIMMLNMFPKLQKKFRAKSFDIVKYRKLIRLIKLQRVYVSELNLLRIKLHHHKYNQHQYSNLIKRVRILSRKLHDVNQKLKHYKIYVHRANVIMNKLLTDVRFSVAISASYLIYNYETAKRKKYWKPYLKAISRYNGGWLNYTYVRKVMKHLKLINKLIKKGVIHD